MTSQTPSVRRYSRDDLERILGKAGRHKAAVAATQDGLEPEDAKAAVLEVATAIGMDPTDVEVAFEEEAAEHAERRQWLVHVTAAPSTQSIAERIAEAVLDRWPYDAGELTTRKRDTHRIVDPDAHAQGELLSGLARNASGTVPLVSTPNTQGTRPARRLMFVLPEPRVTYLLGFIPWRRVRARHAASIWVIDMGQYYLLEGELIDPRVAAAIGDALYVLELGPMVRRGRFVNHG